MVISVNYTVLFSQILSHVLCSCIMHTDPCDISQGDISIRQQFPPPGALLDVNVEEFLYRLRF